MQTKHMLNGTQENLWDLQSVDQAQGKKWIWTDSPEPQLCGRHAHISSTASEGRRDSCDCLPGLAQLVIAAPPGLGLPKDKTITISVVRGPSKGLVRQMVKPHVSVGRTGGGADIEIDDPQLSDLHCAVGVKNEVIRLCDLDSPSGTYIEVERVEVAALSHLSEFRVGSSLLLVTVLPTQAGPAEGVPPLGAQQENSGCGSAITE